jgi:hypothetical protein
MSKKYEYTAVMHHGDPKHIKKAFLQIVVYKHIDDDDDDFFYEICSIYKCQYIDMFIIVDELWDNFHKMFEKQLKKLGAEKFYLVTLKVNKLNDFVWSDAVEVTDRMHKAKPELGLH